MLVLTAVVAHHLYGSCRAVACAVAAHDTVGHGQAVFSYPHGMAYLRARFLGFGQMPNSSRRAHLGAACAFGAAISVFITDAWLHQVEGINTSVGHCDTHNWQDVQCLAMLDALSDPGGVMGVLRCGSIFLDIGARPPSSFLFFWAFAADAAANALPMKNSRLPLSTVSFLSVGCCFVA